MVWIVFVSLAGLYWFEWVWEWCCVFSTTCFGDWSWLWSGVCWSASAVSTWGCTAFWYGLHFSSRTSVPLLVPSVVFVVYTQKIIPTCKQLYTFLGSFLKGWEGSIISQTNVGFVSDFKGNAGQTSERQCRACIGFSLCICYTILNWAELIVDVTTDSDGMLCAWRRYLATTVNAMSRDQTPGNCLLSIKKVLEVSLDLFPWTVFYGRNILNSQRHLWIPDAVPHW